MVVCGGGVERNAWSWGPIVANHSIWNRSTCRISHARCKGCKRLQQRYAAELVIMMRIEITQSCLWPTTRSIPIGVIGWPSLRLNSLWKWIPWLICKCRWHDFCSAASWRLILSNVWQHWGLYWPTANICNAQPVIPFPSSLVHCLFSPVNQFIRRHWRTNFCTTSLIHRLGSGSFGNRHLIRDLLLLGWW